MVKSCVLLLRYVSSFEKLTPQPVFGSAIPDILVNVSPERLYTVINGEYWCATAKYVSSLEKLHTKTKSW